MSSIASRLFWMIGVMWSLKSSRAWMSFVFCVWVSVIFSKVLKSPLRFSDFVCLSARSCFKLVWLLNIRVFRMFSWSETFFLSWISKSVLIPVFSQKAGIPFESFGPQILCCLSFLGLKVCADLSLLLCKLSFKVWAYLSLLIFKLSFKVCADLSPEFVEQTCKHFNADSNLVYPSWGCVGQSVGAECWDRLSQGERIGRCCLLIL